MNLRLSLLAAAVTLAALAGCYTGSAVDTNAAPAQPVVDTNRTDPTSEESTDTHTNVVDPLTGLPCDLAVMLKSSCGGCHGATPKNDAPNTLLGYDDLVATSSADPNKTVAQRALSRMKSTKAPMPPDGNLGPDEIAILDGWIKSGMPKGSCGAETTEPDAGTTSTKKDAGTKPPPPPPVSVCTSGVTVDPDLVGSAMKPGNACIDCHTQQMGPKFTAAGTVFPSLFEPNDCNGAQGVVDAVKVLIIDANGAMHASNVNAAGNFSVSAVLPTPYRAMVVRGNSVKEMKGTQTDGDCNGCHTEFGSKGAPGRILEP